MIVVSDTSPVIALIRINQIQLLQELFREVLIPPSVKDELNKAHFTTAERTIYQNCDWLTVRAVSGKVITNNDLDAGELEAISLAKEINADYLLIDEKAGRKVAIDEGLKIIGVIGLLLLGKEKGLLEEVKLHLDGLISKSDFWITESLYDQILIQAGEK